MLACLPIFKCDHNPFPFSLAPFFFSKLRRNSWFSKIQKLIKTQVFIFFAWPIERFWKAANAWKFSAPSMLASLESLLFFYSRGFFNPYTQALLGVPLAAAAQPNATAATAPAALNHHPLLGQLQVCLFPCSLRHSSYKCNVFCRAFDKAWTFLDWLATTMDIIRELSLYLLVLLWLHRLLQSLLQLQWLIHTSVKALGPSVMG